jgi:hypothetical protein
VTKNSLSPSSIVHTSKEYIERRSAKPVNFLLMLEMGLRFSKKRVAIKAFKMTLVRSYLEFLYNI